MEEKSCLECGVKIPIRPWYAHVKFCSIKCKNRNMRKNPRYIEQQNRLSKEWLIKNKERSLAYHREWEKKNYQKRREKTKRWLAKNPNYNKEYEQREYIKLRRIAQRKTERAKELLKKTKQRFKINHPNYDRQFYLNNKELCKKHKQKYTHSDKGKATWWRRYDEKRKRNINYLGRKIDLPDKETIKMLRERDKVCFYCNCEFDYVRYSNPKYPSFDHINRDLPLNKINAVICCRSCNSSKNDTEVLTWLKKKGLEPSSILLDLLEKQKQYIKLMS